MVAQMNRDKQQIVAEDIDFLSPSLHQTVPGRLQFLEKKGVEGVRLWQFLILAASSHNEIEVEVDHLKRSNLISNSTSISLERSLHRSARMCLEAF